MKRLVRGTFCFQERQLEELKTLSEKTGIPQAMFVREGLDRILKRYRYITTMKPFHIEEARYLLSGSRSISEEELVREEQGSNRKRLNSKRGLLDFKRQSNGEDQP